MDSDRESFICANAVALVEQRDELIARLKAEVTRLLRTKREHRRLIHDLRAELEAARVRFEVASERIAAQSELLSKKSEKNQ